MKLLSAKEFIGEVPLSHAYLYDGCIIYLPDLVSYLFKIEEVDSKKGVFRFMYHKDLHMALVFRTFEAALKAKVLIVAEKRLLVDIIPVKDLDQDGTMN